MSENNPLKWAIMVLLLFIFGLFGLPSPTNIMINILKAFKSVLPFLPQEAQRANQMIDNWILGFMIIGWISLLIAIAIIVATVTIGRKREFGKF